MPQVGEAVGAGVAAVGESVAGVVGLDVVPAADVAADVVEGVVPKEVPAVVPMKVGMTVPWYVPAGVEIAPAAWTPTRRKAEKDFIEERTTIIVTNFCRCFCCWDGRLLQVGFGFTKID